MPLLSGEDFAMRFLLSALLALGFIALPATADAAQQPWQQAQALLDAAMNDLPHGGLQSLQPRVAEMEKALAEAQTGIIPVDDKHSIALGDGIGETLIAMAAATEANKKAGHPEIETAAVANPYPQLSLLLGSYYDEVGRFDDAIRVLDRGMALSFAPELRMSETAPLLLAEKGYALQMEKRYVEMLAAFDDALDRAKDGEAGMRARLYRGRGFALTELGRLDEAEAAYHEALKLVPGDPKSLNELEYISNLRKAGKN
jgi:tetratricopeptide (TPR) repeat protein